MPFETGVRARLTRLFMVSTNERFAILYRLGIEPRFIDSIDLEGAPDIAVGRLERKADGWGGLCEELNPKINSLPLPSGIPEPQRK